MYFHVISRRCQKDDRGERSAGGGGFVMQREAMLVHSCQSAMESEINKTTERAAGSSAPGRNKLGKLYLLGSDKQL